MSSDRFIRTASLVAALTIAGRALGFLRDVTIAHFFGASAETDAFLIAWTLPETAAPLLLEGALIFVLIPLFARADKESQLPATLGESAATVSGLLVLLSTAALGAAPILARLLGPGLADHDLATDAVRLASPTLALLGIAGFLTSALRTRAVFGPTAAVYIAYNIGIISSIFALRTQLGVLSAALGLTIGACLMVAIQVPSFWRLFGRIRLRFSTQSVRSLTRAFFPIGLFVILNHAQVYVERIMASGLDAGSISHLNYAERIGQLPTSIVVAIAIVSLPAVAHSAASQNTAEMRAAFHRDIAYVLVLIAPAVIFFVIGSPDTVGLLLERGAFQAADTAATADVLPVYALGLVARVCMAIALLPLFSTTGVTARPAKAAALGLAVTIGVNLLLIGPLGLRGLAVGNALGVTTTATLLMYTTHRTLFSVDWNRLGGLLLKTVVAAASAGGVALVGLWLTAGQTYAVRVLTAAALVGGVYAWVAKLLGVTELGEVLRAVLPHRGRTSGRPS